MINTIYGSAIGHINFEFLLYDRVHRHRRHRRHATLSLSNFLNKNKACHFESFVIFDLFYVRACVSDSKKTRRSFSEQSHSNTAEM